MAYSSRDNRRSGRSSSRNRSQRQQRSSNGRRTTGPNQGEGRSRRGTLTRPDTGYSLHSRRVRHDQGGGGGIVSMLLRPRVLLLIAIVILVIVVMIVGVTSCIRRNNEKAAQPVEEVKPKNEQDERVAAGVSAAMTSKFTQELDAADQLATIAANADKYEDERMLTLAIEEPASRTFIAAYPDSDKASRPYDEEVKRGEVPKLYDWDERWGAVTYGNGCLAVTGSGPTTLAMAYMGLTGKTDFSPTEIAQQASKSNYADGDSGSKSELFAKLSNSMGLAATSYDPSAETLLSLGDTTVFAVELKAGSLTENAHWALVVNMNEDGTVTVFDPTSTYVSDRAWDMATVASSSSSFYAISPSKTTLTELEKESSSSGSTDESTASDSTSSKKDSSSSSSSSSKSGNESTSSEEDEYSEYY